MRSITNLSWSGSSYTSSNRQMLGWSIEMAFSTSANTRARDLSAKPLMDKVFNATSRPVLLFLAVRTLPDIPFPSTSPWTSYFWLKERPERDLMSRVARTWGSTATFWSIPLVVLSRASLDVAPQASELLASHRSEDVREGSPNLSCLITFEAPCISTLRFVPASYSHLIKDGFAPAVVDTRTYLKSRHALLSMGTSPHHCGYADGSRTFASETSQSPSGAPPQTATDCPISV
mmetsp:Transcript_25719/g.46990  ORF Transcript_25719/g.46990 Transcript_25719/m.46990 type:complete len:233 (+) Transcript_25719:1645-2343(+)